MEKIEIAVELTKAIFLLCQEAKNNFAKSVSQVCDSVKLVDLPVKRLRDKDTKSNSSSEEETFYKDTADLRIGIKSETKPDNKKNEDSSVEEEQDKIFDLDSFIGKYRNSLIGKEGLQKILVFVKGFKDMGLKERANVKNVLGMKISWLKAENDKQSEALLKELQGKVNEISSDLFVDEDWDALLENLKSSIKEKNYKKVSDLIKRAHNALPSHTNEKILQELKSFAKVLQKIVKKVDKEASSKAELILKKLGAIQVEERKAGKDIELVARGLNIADPEKKAINTIDAKQTVKPKRRY